MLTQSIVSALTNLVLLVGLPLGGYALYQRRRQRRSLAEIARRAGLVLGEPRYLGYCALLAAACVAAVLLWPPPIEPFTREGSAQHAFRGLGLSATSLAMALIYGVITTGFSEELLFRGLIAGSLGRRLGLRWANLCQALIFLAPHLLILFVMPELWGLLLFVFAMALVSGWARIASGSIVGPWLIHAAVNVAVCLSVAQRLAF